MQKYILCSSEEKKYIENEKIVSSDNLRYEVSGKQITLAYHMQKYILCSSEKKSKIEKCVPLDNLRHEVSGKQPLNSFHQRDKFGDILF